MLKTLKSFVPGTEANRERRLAAARKEFAKADADTRKAFECASNLEVRLDEGSNFVVPEDAVRLYDAAQKHATGQFNALHRIKTALPPEGKSEIAALEAKQQQADELRSRAFESSNYYREMAKKPSPRKFRSEAEAINAELLEGKSKGLLEILREESASDKARSM